MGIPTLLLLHHGHIFVDLQITDKFHLQKSIIILRVSNYKRVQKEGKSYLRFQKCLLPLARECSLLTVMCKYRV